MNTGVEEVPSHMERALGPISKGWADSSSKSGVQIVSFENAPIAGVTTYATLGMNKYLLRQSSGEMIRMELLTSVESGLPAGEAARLLLAIAEDVINRTLAPARGQLLGFEESAKPPAGLKTFFCTSPSPFNHQLVATQNFDPPLVFVYLIAVLESEADLVRNWGWRWFEEQLEAQDPNIWDLSRTKGVEPL